MTQVSGFTLPTGWSTVNVSRCRGCGMRVMWCRNEFGRGAALGPSGDEHRLSCPNVERMARGRFTLLDSKSERRAG